MFSCHETHFCLIWPLKYSPKFNCLLGSLRLSNPNELFRHERQNFGCSFKPISTIVVSVVPLQQQDIFVRLHLLQETLNPLHITILYLQYFMKPYAKAPVINMGLTNFPVVFLHFIAISQHATIHYIALLLLQACYTTLGWCDYQYALHGWHIRDKNDEWLVPVWPTIS